MKILIMCIGLTGLLFLAASFVAWLLEADDRRFEKDWKDYD